MLSDKKRKKKTLVIGSQKKKISLPSKDGYFNNSDLKEYGYPKTIKDAGEFYFWYPRENNAAVFRNWSSELVLYLYWTPSITFDVLGVRLAKIFP